MYSNSHDILCRHTWFPTDDFYWFGNPSPFLSSHHDVDMFGSKWIVSNIEVNTVEIFPLGWSPRSLVNPCVFLWYHNYVKISCKDNIHATPMTFSLASAVISFDFWFVSTASQSRRLYTPTSVELFFNVSFVPTLEVIILLGIIMFINQYPNLRG